MNSSTLIIIPESFTVFINNIFSYALLILPVAILVCYLKKSPSFTHGNSFQNKYIRKFVLDSEVESSGGTSGKVDKLKSNSSNNASFWQRSSLLCFLVLGLQGSYITWGILQEKVQLKFLR